MGVKSDKSGTQVFTVERADTQSVIRADNAKLAELGYKSEFRREFTVRFLIFIHRVAQF